jgi:hypothetical protein
MKLSGKPQTRQIALAICLLMLIGTSHADSITLKSSAEPVTVIELFTSHGCSSCPPADAWLRKFTTHKDLWNRIIPMAFHVDYWNYLGWEDCFARPEYSSRQKSYQQSGRLRTIYTPGFVVNGREWRGFFRRDALEIPLRQKVGVLDATVKPTEEITARFSPEAKTDTPELKAHAAVLGFDMNSEIGGGENSGRKLTEDFVVLGTSSTAANSEMRWNIPWPELKDNSAKRTAVVVWLSRGSGPTPIQAVGGWIN